MTATPDQIQGTSHAGLQAWVDEVAALTTPDRVVWVDGSEDEWERLTAELVASGTFVKLNEDEEAQLVLVRLRPQRRGARRGPHLHRLGARGGRRPDEQLGRPGRAQGDDDRALPRLHDGPDDVRHPLRHGPPRRHRPDVRRRGHRLGIRRRQHADHGPHRDTGAHRDGGAERHLRQGPALGRARPSRPARPTSRGRATTPSTSPTSPRPTRSGPSAPATAATRCSGRSATRCGSRARSRATRAGWPSTCSCSS